MIGRDTRKAADAWDEKRAVAQLVEDLGIDFLYHKVGCSPQLRGLLDQLTVLCQARVADPQAFHKSLAEGNLSSLEIPGPFLDALAGAGADEGKILEALNADIVSASTVSDSLPIEIRVVDCPSFLKALDRIEDVLSRRADLWDPVNEELVRLSKALRASVTGEEQEIAFGWRFGYFARDISSLCKEAREDAEERAEQLYTLLADLVTFRRDLVHGEDYNHQFESRVHPWSTRLERTWPGSWNRARSTPEEHAKIYLKATWMHTPVLTDYILTNLLDSVMLPSQALRRSLKRGVRLGLFLRFLLVAGCVLVIHLLFSNGLPWVAWPILVCLVWWLLRYLSRQTSADRLDVDLDRWERTLQLVRSEVAMGCYDGREAVRRLREMERSGNYVPTLVYALLRLHIESVRANYSTSRDQSGQPNAGMHPAAQKPGGG